MSLADKLKAISENVQKVFSAGKNKKCNEFWDSFQNFGTRTFYRNAFAGDCWNTDTLVPKYKVCPVDVNDTTRAAAEMFVYFSMKRELWFSVDTETFDFTKCITLNSTFSNARFNEIDIDIPNVISLNDTFRCGDGTGGTRKITIRNGTKIASVSNPFFYASNLVELNLINTVIACNGWNFQRSTRLSAESVKSIIDALKSDTQNLTITLSQTAVDNADFSLTGYENYEILFAEKPNWTIALL